MYIDPIEVKLELSLEEAHAIVGALRIAVSEIERAIDAEGYNEELAGIQWDMNNILDGMIDALGMSNPDAECDGDCDECAGCEE